MKKFFLLTLIVFVSAANIFAAPGQLDPTFNGTGKLETGVLLSLSSGITFRAVAIQPDGKILAAAAVGGQNDTRTLVIRYHPNGSVDQNFGNNGIAQLLFPGGGQNIVAEMALQSDGKIVLGISEFGATTGFCGASRLNADGSIDTGFGNSGRVTIPTSGTWCAVKGVAVQSDGRAVVLGQLNNNLATSENIAIMRFDQNGAPDKSFDDDGLRTVSTGSSGDPVRTLLIQPDGKILVVGEKQDVGDHLIFRFNADGSLDQSFGVGGKAIIGTPDVEGNLAAALQPDGKIILSGSYTSVPAIAFRGFEMTRVNADGIVDNGFGTNGRVLTPESERHVRGATAVALQADGKIILGGAFYSASGIMLDFAAARYSASGILETGAQRSKFVQGEGVLTPIWGDRGISRVQFSPKTYSGITGLKVDAAGRVLAFGFDSNGQSTYMVMARFQGDASPYASISGTIRTAGGVPIRNAMVTLSGGSLNEPVTVMTNNFGIYYFTGLPVTETYTVTASAKRFRFSTSEARFMLNADRADLDFMANQ